MRPSPKSSTDAQDGFRKNTFPLSYAKRMGPTALILITLAVIGMEGDAINFETWTWACGTPEFVLKKWRRENPAMAAHETSHQVVVGQNQKRIHEGRGIGRPKAPVAP